MQMSSIRENLPLAFLSMSFRQSFLTLWHKSFPSGKEPTTTLFLLQTTNPTACLMLRSTVCMRHGVPSICQLSPARSLPVKAALFVVSFIPLYIQSCVIPYLQRIRDNQKVSGRFRQNRNESHTNLPFKNHHRFFSHGARFLTNRSPETNWEAY
jgi:hypothetical protein